MDYVSIYLPGNGARHVGHSQGLKNNSQIQNDQSSLFILALSLSHKSANGGCKKNNFHDIQKQQQVRPHCLCAQVNTKTAEEIIPLTNNSNSRRFHGCFLLEVKKKRDKRFKILELVTVFKTEQGFFFTWGPCSTPARCG